MSALFEKVDRVPLEMRGKLIRNIRITSIVAVVLTIGCIGLSCSSETTSSTYTEGGSRVSETVHQSAGERVGYLFLGVVLGAGAVAGFAVDSRLRSQEKRLKRYPAVLKGVEQIRLSEIASIMTVDAATVSTDIELMIDAGLIDDLYVDHAASKVVSKKYTLGESYKTVVTCPGCGANTEIIVGVRQFCDYCKQPLVAD